MPTSEPLCRYSRRERRCIDLGGNRESAGLWFTVMGIAAGLVIGKPLGITLLTRLSVLTGCCRLPPDVDFRSVFVVGCMAGIGFTLSAFICHLAFEAQLLAISKLAVLLGTGIAGVGGLLIGRVALRPA